MYPKNNKIPTKERTKEKLSKIPHIPPPLHLPGKYIKRPRKKVRLIISGYVIFTQLNDFKNHIFFFLNRLYMYDVHIGNFSIILSILQKKEIIEDGIQPSHQYI